MRKILPIFFSLFLALSMFAAPSGAGTLDELGGAPFLKEFTVYPNPTSGAVTITLEAFAETSELKLKVFSLIGQEMYTEQLSPFSGVKRFQLDLTRFPKGIYMVEISDGEKSRIKRVSVI
jgi:hypothetical protein